MPRRTPHLIACAVCIAWTPGTSALTFGQPASSAVLGQALDMRIPVGLDTSESLTTECVSAEIMHGETRLDAQVVRVSLEPSADGTGRLLRVRTLVPIEEPVVQVTVGAGCPRSAYRRFTSFPDPPDVRVAAEPASPAVVLAPPVPAQPGAQEPIPTVRRSPQPATAGGPSASAAERARAPRPPSRSTAAASTPKAKAPARRSRPAVELAGANVSSAAPGGVAPPASASRLVLDPIAPRLKLDIEEPVAMGPAAAASAADASTPDIDLARLQMLERTLNQLQRETRTQRVDTQRLQAELQEARDGQRWVPWLIGLLALAILALAWLAWRLRQASQPQWWEDAAPAPATPPSPDDQEPAAPVPARKFFDDDDEEPEREYRVQATLPPDEVEWPPMTAPVVPAGGDAPWLAPAPAVGAPALREGTADELLDLEQQAEFFVALGQEDAAIELLMDHLRGTDGLSPMPYMQLMQIHRRRDDRPAYERIRTNFNQRFNAHAPAFDDDADEGRVLEDYPEVIDRVQSVWPAPSHAMALLESMMFRRGTTEHHFDLPAYRDLLTLFALARDRLQHGDAEAPVDLLLPFEPEALAPPPFGSSGPTAFDFVLTDGNGNRLPDPKLR